MERAYITKPLELAQQLARIILEDSYVSPFDGPQRRADGTVQIDLVPERVRKLDSDVGGVGDMVRREEQACVEGTGREMVLHAPSYVTKDRRMVYDVLLFGSTLRGEAHDIDVVIIHNLHRLSEYESFLKYESDKQVIDYDVKFDEKARYYPSTILRELEGREIIFYDNEYVMRRYFRSVVDSAHRSGIYAGVFDLDYFVEPVSFTAHDLASFMLQLDEKVKELFRDLKQQTVCGQVEHLFKERELEVDKNLDLLVMSREALFAEGMGHRNMMIKLCRDPTFWYTVFSEGRLFNVDTGLFDTRVEQKYPRALEGFRVEGKVLGL